MIGGWKMQREKFESKMSLVAGSSFIYRVNHRIMEGDCQVDHGPKVMEIKSFFADIYPVTNLQYGYFLEETGYWPEDDTNFLRHWEGKKCPENLEKHPVTWISLADAWAYAKYRDCRLPTEFEWQFMAGGEERLKYPWGNQFIEKHSNSRNKETTPVDAYPMGKGPYGQWDLCGNVWEWTDSKTFDGQHYFALLRGGSYYVAPHFWHTEGGGQPNDFHLKMPLLNEALNRCSTIGFRCVRTNEEED